MTRILLLASCLLAALSVTACKIVKTGTPEAVGAVAPDAAEDSHIASVLGATYATKLLPLIANAATPLPDLRAAIAADLAAAGTAHGNRGAGEGAAWNFAVKGSGVVISANLESRARKADLDSDGDGKPDLTLQFGPVIKGTALRDVAPFYDFGDFRDQIEFAKLARAINDQVSADLKLPEGDLTGKTLTFTGALALKSASEPFVITAVSVQAAP